MCRRELRQVGRPSIALPQGCAGVTDALGRARSSRKGRSCSVRWGRFVYRRRRWVARSRCWWRHSRSGSPLAASSVLSTGGWYDPSSESQQVAHRLAADFGQGGSSLVVLFQAPGRTDAASPAFQAQVAAAADRPAVRLARRRRSWATPRPAARASSAPPGDATWVLVNLNLTEDQAIGAVDGIRSEIATPTGHDRPADRLRAPDRGHVRPVRDATWRRAETVSLPIALVILLLVFGTLVAAGLPLLVAGLTIPTTLALVWVVAQHMTMSIFVTSVVTMLGLALAIDYSLFMVSRFREELACGATVEEAVERTVATSGKAVAFSGTAVAIGLSGLLLFRAPTLSSMGIGGALIALCSVAYALTFLPAALSMLGPRVERLRVRNPFRRSPLLPRRRGLRPVRPPMSRSTVNRVAGSGSPPPSWRRPVAVLLPILALLLAFGVPFLGEQQGLPGADILPAGIEARAGLGHASRPSSRPAKPARSTCSSPSRAIHSRPRTRPRWPTTRPDWPGLTGVSRVDGPFSIAGLDRPAAAVVGSRGQRSSARRRRRGPRRSTP